MLPPERVEYKRVNLLIVKLLWFS